VLLPIMQARSQEEVPKADGMFHVKPKPAGSGSSRPIAAHLNPSVARLNFITPKPDCSKAPGCGGAPLGGGVA
jgi:hypothetical protein